MREGRFEFYQPTPLLRELGILAFLADDPNSSQKRIAERVGLGSAMVHAYLHNLQDQGLVEFRGSSSKKLQYVLTPEGRRQLESLAGKHLAEVSRLIEAIESAILRAIERAAADGVRWLAVIVDPPVRVALESMKEHAGVHLVFPKTEDVDPEGFYESMLAPADAALVAVMAPDDRLRAMIGSLERGGMRVYRAA